MSHDMPVPDEQSFAGRVATEEQNPQAGRVWAHDPGLSLKATGILAFLAFGTSTGQATTTDLLRCCRDGQNSLASGLQELLAAKYICGSRARNSNGTLGDTVYWLAQAPPPDVNTVRVGNQATDLYRYFDRFHVLLYLGVTGDERSRRSGHRHSSWDGFVVRSTTFRHRTRESAELAEYEAIRKERPVFNIAGVDPDVAERRRTRYLEDPESFTDWLMSSPTH